jgi:uncharacterized protein (DUF2342 family)
VPKAERTRIIRENQDGAVAMAAVVNSPLRIVSDTAKSDALNPFNERHRSAQLSAVAELETVVTTLEGIADMVIRETSSPSRRLPSCREGSPDARTICDR